MKRSDIVKLMLTDSHLSKKAYAVYSDSWEEVFYDRKGFWVGDANLNFVHEKAWSIEEVNAYFEDMHDLIECED